MVDECESPSAGWREVYSEMAADPGAEEAAHVCPDCGRTCENLLRDVYECEEHGVFRASASADDAEDGEESSEASIEETDVTDGEAVADEAEKTDTEAADDAPDKNDPVESRAREPAD